MQEMKYDVVVIGSGLGGLICARQLARRGRKVLVLERQPKPGGCLQSYRRGRWEFDTGLHYVGGLDEGQPLHDAFEALGLLRLPWQRLDPYGFDRITIGGQTFPLVEGFEPFADTLGEYFPQERSALQRFVAMLRQLPTWEDSAHVNAYGYLASLFHDPLLLNVVSAAAMRMEMRRESLPLFTYAHGMSSYIQSSWRLKGSGGQIADALIGDIIAAGGEVCCGAEVMALNERGGKIVSASCTDGCLFEGGAFISDVHPQLTFGWVKASHMLKGIFRHRIAALENTAGMFTVSLVVKPNTLKYFNHNKYVFRKADVWCLSEENDAVNGIMISAKVPEDEAPYVRQIDLLTPLPWSRFQPWAATAVGRRGQDYEVLKQRLADECMQLAERVLPGLHDMVEKRYTSTPLTWRDYTLSPCGSAFGVRKDCRNPLMTLLSPKTPVPNLFLTGQCLVLHGLEGVTQTAFNTLAIIDKTRI